MKNTQENNLVDKGGIFYCPKGQPQVRVPRESKGLLILPNAPGVYFF